MVMIMTCIYGVWLGAKHWAKPSFSPLNPLGVSTAVVPIVPLRSLRHRDIKNLLLATQLPRGGAGVQTQYGPRAHAFDHYTVPSYTVRAILPHPLFT